MSVCCTTITEGIVDIRLHSTRAGSKPMESRTSRSEDMLTNTGLMFHQLHSGLQKAVGGSGNGSAENVRSGRRATLSEALVDAVARASKMHLPLLAAARFEETPITWTFSTATDSQSVLSVLLLYSSVETTRKKPLTSL